MNIKIMSKRKGKNRSFIKNPAGDMELDVYCKVPYTSAGYEDAIPRIPCSDQKKNLSLFQILSDDVVEFDLYGHNRLE